MMLEAFVPRVEVVKEALLQIFFMDVDGWESHLVRQTTR